MIAMKKRILLGTAVLCLILITFLAPGMVSSDKITETDVNIYDGGYESESFFGLSLNEKIDVSVTVTSPTGGTVDVYVLSYGEYTSNYPNGNFEAEITRENVETTSFSFKNPDSQWYYLIIDNQDNSKSTDATPTGDVTVDYEYDDPMFADIEAFEDAAETAIFTGMMMCVLGIVVIIVVIVLVVYLVIRAGKDKQPPPQQYPQQYQQPYQQPPPGGYPAQQPYDQPPPQGEPPVQPQEQPPDQPPQAQWPPQQPNQPPNQGQQPPQDQS
jgi:hypothetical protein